MFAFVDMRTPRARMAAPSAAKLQEKEQLRTRVPVAGSWNKTAPPAPTLAPEEFARFPINTLSSNVTATFAHEDPDGASDSNRMPPPFELAMLLRNVQPRTVTPGLVTLSWPRCHKPAPQLATFPSKVESTISAEALSMKRPAPLSAWNERN